MVSSATRGAVSGLRGEIRRLCSRGNERIFAPVSRHGRRSRDAADLDGTHCANGDGLEPVAPRARQSRPWSRISTTGRHRGNGPLGRTFVLQHTAHSYRNSDLLRDLQTFSANAAGAPAVLCRRILNSFKVDNGLASLTDDDWETYRRIVVEPNADRTHAPGSYIASAKKRRAAERRCPMAAAISK